MYGGMNWVKAVSGGRSYQFPVAEGLFSGAAVSARGAVVHISLPFAVIAQLDRALNS